MRRTSTSQMVRVAGSSAFLALAVYARVCMAQAETLSEASTSIATVANERPPRPDWSVSIGGGMLTQPSYPGASSTRLLPLPFIEASYKDRLFLSIIQGAGVNFLATPRVRLGVAAVPEFGRLASSSDQLRGWGDLSIGMSAKLFGRVELLGPGAMLASVRREFGAGNGALVEAGATSTFPRMRHLIVSTTATVTWANGRHTQSYFGVTPAQSAIALAQAQGSLVPAFTAGAGFRDTSLTLLAEVPFDRHWSVQAFVQIKYLLGDAAKSPLTQTRVQPTFAGFLAYSF